MVTVNAALETDTTKATKIKSMNFGFTIELCHGVIYKDFCGSKRESSEYGVWNARNW